MKRLFCILTLTCVGIWAGSASASSPYRELASELLRGLDTVKIEHLSANGGYGAPRIAVLPFAPDDLPVSAEQARKYNRELLVELQNQSYGRFDFVARDAIDKLVHEIRATETNTDDIDERIADLRASTRADILITGSIHKQDGITLLSYQAISSENAHLFVSTIPKQVGSNHQVTFLRTKPIGHYRATIEEAETLLSDLGYDVGDVDGYLTEETRQGLREYQADSALPINGRMTRQVVENMRRDNR